VQLADIPSLQWPSLAWLVGAIIIITYSHYLNQWIWPRTGLCGGCGQCMALRNLELNARNDDDDDVWSLLAAQCIVIGPVCGGVFVGVFVNCLQLCCCCHYGHFYSIKCFCLNFAANALSER